MRNASGHRGFTLIELLVVIIIIVILASIAVVLAGAFVRGQGVRQGTLTIVQTLARARQLSVNQRVPHFVAFYKGGDTGSMKIYRDANGNSLFDYLPSVTDTPIDQDLIFLPRLSNFYSYVTYVGFTPSGSVIYPPTYSEVTSSAFDAEMAKPAPALTGDIVLTSPDGKYFMCIDIDKPSGRVRRHHFIAKD